MKHTLLFATLLIFAGCTSNQVQHQNTDELLEKVLNSCYPDEQEEQLFTVDQNFDGKPDFYTEYYDFSYVMFHDRNFDGNPDETYEFDSSNDFLLDGRLDEDFDGYFETQLVMHQGVVKYEFVDSNNDNQFDVVKYYKDGVMEKMEILYVSNDPASSTIQTVFVNFGVPYKTKSRSTNMSLHDFHLEQIKKIQSQNMYKEAANTL